jgi:hypothetical protein
MTEINYSNPLIDLHIWRVCMTYYLHGSQPTIETLTLFNCGCRLAENDSEADAALFTARSHVSLV